MKKIVQPQFKIIKYFDQRNLGSIPRILLSH